MTTEITPKIGMRVEFTRTDHKSVPPGRCGVIDVVDGNGIDFWVATDCGGFYGWTSFASWKLLPSEKTQEDNDAH